MHHLETEMQENLFFPLMNEQDVVGAKLVQLS